MPQNHCRRSAAVLSLLLLVAAGLLAAAARAVEPKVAGMNELAIFLPGTHDRGLPAVRFQPKCGNQLEVDIPPTVHVHRYYYSGDKEFQGPIIQGGPTVVVANHPKTGERMYVNVTLPPGAPKIVHNKQSITYLYADRRVEICFSCRHPEQVTIKQLSGQGAGRRWHELATSVRTKTHQCLQASPLAHAVAETGRDAGKLVVGAKAAAGSLAAQGIQRVKQAAHALPGVTALESYGEQQAARVQQTVIDNAAARKDRLESKYLPTNR